MHGNYESFTVPSKLTANFLNSSFKKRHTLILLKKKKKRKEKERKKRKHVAVVHTVS